MSGYLKDQGVDPGKARTAYDEFRDLNNKYGEMATDVALAAGGALPPPLGTAADVASLGRSLWKGDWGGALMDLVGVVPLIGDAAKAGKIANKLNDLRKALDVTGSALGKTFKNTKEAAAKYWADMAKARKEAYDAAVKKCNGSKACIDKLPSPKGPQYKTLPSDGPRGKWTGERGDGVFTPSNGTPPITYKNGFPDFGPPHSTHQVEIPMRGDHDVDFRLADEAARRADPNFTRPDTHTWHHKEDGVTMQLVPKDTHNVALGGGNHTGGASLYSGANKDTF
jgi:A nuclease of the HNH/ENDO VII superfamily with conserved WHH